MRSRWAIPALLCAILSVSLACAPAAPSPTAAPPKPAATQAPAKAAEAPKPAAKPTEAPAAKPAEKPAASPVAKVEAKPAAQAPAEWEQVLAAAKKEGRVAVAGAPGNLYREAMRVFEAKYPDIKLEWNGFNARDFQVRFAAERNGGQFLWDVDINGPTTWDIDAKKAGDLQPLRPALLLPEVRDESAWFGGFQKAFLDTEKQYVFSFQAEVSPQVYVNRDFIPQSELSTVKGLLDAKWKGKIAVGDPRTDGAGNGRFAAWTGQLGEDFVRKVLAQNVGITQDGRQLTEWTVRGQYPIAIGIGGADIAEFVRQGVGKNVLPLGGQNEPEAWRLSSAFGVVRLISKPPNPNAAKVFLNWLLSREGQTAWVEKAARASRRTDVLRIEDQSPKPGVDYYDIDREENLALRDKAKQISKSVLG